MYLHSVRVRNFRSFWSDDARPSADIDLCRGVNYLAGANNSGKSNLLRALAMALDGQAHPYQPETDRPHQKRADTQSTVTLDFRFSTKPRGPLQTLVRYVNEYEQTVAGSKGPTYASRGIIQYYVQAAHGKRQEYFLAAGAGAQKGSHEKLNLALEQFRKVVRFVDIRSGEDLQSLLKRGFREILGTVVREEQDTAIDAARQKRDEYIKALEHALQPLATHVQERIRRYVRDIQRVQLVPSVPDVEDAIAGAQFLLQDAVLTDLERKGTGVRGATLLMLLSFIAQRSRRAVVFVIEEPESFLHPEAHRELGDGLEIFAERPDVSVLVTTHSPFLFRSDRLGDKARLFTVKKDEQGRSIVQEGKAEIARSELLGSPVFTALLARAEALPSSAKLVLVVEGRTDLEYLVLAARKLSMPLDHIHIVAAGGAKEAAFQAITLRGLGASHLVSALFDQDENGKRAQEILLGGKWQKNTDVLSYALWVPPENVDVEAEDMYPNTTFARFFAKHEEAIVIDGKQRRPSGTWRYSLTEQGKRALLSWLEGSGTPEDFVNWGRLITTLNQIIGKREAADQRRRQSAEASGRPGGVPADKGRPTTGSSGSNGQNGDVPTTDAAAKGKDSALEGDAGQAEPTC
jgi:predicted ATPase